MDTATKTGKDAAKTSSKRVVQKTAAATGDLIGNKIADEITSIGKPKEKGKTKKNRRNLHFTRKIATNYWWFETVLSTKCDIIEYKLSFKIANFLDITLDVRDWPIFVAKNGFKFMMNQKKTTVLTKKSKLKRQC